MASAQQIINYCKSLNFTQLKQYGYDRYREVFDYLNPITHNHLETNKGIIECLVVCFALDGYLSNGEWEFLKYIFKISEINRDYYEEMIDQKRSISIKRDVSNLCKRLPGSVKVSFISLCIAAMCSDGRFTYDDLDFLEDCLLG